MRISVLGPLEVTGGDDSPLSIGGPKPKALLTALVARPNVVLPVDTIVDVLWGEQAPLSARTTVRAYMSRMRGVLGTAALPSRSSGYLLRVGAGRTSCCGVRVTRGARAGPKSPS